MIDIFIIDSWYAKLENLFCDIVILYQFLILSIFVTNITESVLLKYYNIT